MGHSDQDKNVGTPLPGDEDRILRAQKDQRTNCEAAHAAAEAYALQDLPEIVIRHGLPCCPYAMCQKRQWRLTIGVHTCTNGWCERKISVPDNELTRKIAKKLRPDNDLGWRASNLVPDDFGYGYRCRPHSRSHPRTSFRGSF